MANTIGSWFRNTWNTFFNRDPTEEYKVSGPSYSYRPDKPRLSYGNEKSIINSIYTRIAIDATSLDIRHVQLDEDGRYTGDCDSYLNNCLTVSANIDQAARNFRYDMVMSLLDEGVIAIVPVDTTDDPNKTESYDIETMRVGKVLEWYPKEVKVRLYNDRTGEKEDIIIKKNCVALPENPFYSVMNEPNSTSKRLIRKLNLLDAIDEQSSSGKLDIIIQLPYAIKTEARKNQADERKRMIEEQLIGSKYGIAYIDSSERITQLNRPAENNLMNQVQYLTSMLYSQLGMTDSIMDGTAAEETMNNYYDRTIEPIVDAIVEEMNRKFISKTARTQGQAIIYFKDPFKLVPVSKIAEIADKFTRNEIMTSNEIRRVVGMKPSKDPNADILRNKNITQNHSENQQMEEEKIDSEEGGLENQNE